jgi:diguanylate cyclase (GGDEF)-like protein/PAS domain S-box-containing protein
VDSRRALLAGALCGLLVGGVVVWLGEAGGARVGLLAGISAAVVVAVACSLARGEAASEQRYLTEGLNILAQANGGAAAGSLRGAFEQAADRVTQLLRRERFMRVLANTGHSLEAVFDLDGRLLWASPAVVELTGYSANECRAGSALVEMLVLEPDRAFVREHARRAAAGERGENVELRLLRKDGATEWIACHWQPFRDEEGSLVGEPLEGVRLSAQSIQTRKETEYKLLETVAELRRAQALSEHYLARGADERQRLTALLNVIRLGILFMDRDHRVQYYNRAAMEIWNAEGEHLLGQREALLQQRIDGMVRQPAAYREHLAEVLASQEVSAPFEIELTDGRVVTDVSAVVQGGEGRGPIGRVWIYEDVTEQHRASQQLTAMAERDPLTNLFNRRRFHEELERMLAEAGRRAQQVGLLTIDLDGFKPINDRYGHQAGDEVLVSLAREIGGTVRRSEMFFRLGGDEFAILVPDTRTQELGELARRVAERIAALRFGFDGGRAGLTASIGIAIHPLDAADGEGLVSASDHAMYAAKAQGKSRWAFAGTVGMSPVRGRQAR